MKSTIAKLSLAIIMIVTCAIAPLPAEEKTPIAGPATKTIQLKKPLVQMAILLDTSGSMSGLIDQARIELWAIVNEFIFAKRNGMEPEVQVALYEYGKSSLNAQEGYIRMIVPFTTDLDKVSEELFALKTNGGSEYCGWVIKEATQALQWSPSPDDLKVVFIAGNEPFTQGPVDYRKACKDAISKAIVVNTIHCGSEKEGIEGNWKDGAALADGRFLNIDHNRAVVHIEAPQDKEIAELSAKLNDTYIAFGMSGTIAYERQATQDLNAATASKEALVQRALAKSSFNYKNESWDLVDAVKGHKTKMEEIEAEQLPENMRKMTPEERKAYIETKAKEREKIQKRIQELNVLRNNYVATEMKKRHGNADTLGKAIITAVREQAVKKNFSFEQPKASPAKEKENSK
ncbi:MAG: VWA domain-containing protein [Sedimentisphaerales bacterium]|nr:VWA domain-containing protein [Sedimentisphaerales bacterium]